MATTNSKKTVTKKAYPKPTAMSNKQVVKKDGKTVVTYDSKKTGAFGMATYPAKVTKVYDNKGNLIRGNRRVQGSYGSSAMERIYDPKKKPAAKPAAKTAVKPTPKPAVKKPAPIIPIKPIFDPMLPITKTKPVAKAPAKTTPKPVTKTPASTTTKPGTGAKPAATTKPGTGKPTPKPTPKPAVKAPVAATKPAAKTVSEVWKEKTGMSWSEAKKQGLSDGSAKSNMELMKKLQSGAVSKDSLNKDSYKATMEKNVADEMSGKITYDAPVDKPAMKKGGSVKRKMKSKKK